MSEYPPGFWVGPDGALHCSVEDVLRSKGIATTEENIEMYTGIFAKQLHDQLPGAVLEVHERSATVARVEFGPADPHCTWCGARPPADAMVVVMVAGPDGATLCTTCGERWEAQKARAARQ